MENNEFTLIMQKFESFDRLFEKMENNLEFLKEKTDIMYQDFQKINYGQESLFKRIDYIEAFEKKCLITTSSKAREMIEFIEKNENILKEMVEHKISNKKLIQEVKFDSAKKIVWGILTGVFVIFSAGLGVLIGFKILK